MTSPDLRVGDCAGAELDDRAVAVDVDIDEACRYGADGFSAPLDLHALLYANPGEERTLRNTDALALRLFRKGAVRLDLPGRRLVLAALDSVVFGVPATPEVQLHIEAMRDCRRINDGRLSKRLWTAYRAEVDPDGNVLRSATKVAQMLGGGNWDQAAAVCGGEPAEDVLANRFNRDGPRRTRVDLLEMLRECAAYLGSSFFGCADYERFAAACKDQPRRVPLALHTNTFLREFGSWRSARMAAGLATLDGEPRRGPDALYTDDRMLLLLAEAAVEYRHRDGARPGEIVLMKWFQSWRASRLAAACARGEDLVIPTASSYANRFGSWGEALVKAGAITVQQMQAVAPGRGRAADRRYLAWSLLQAVKACGPKFGLPTYERWRDEFASVPGAVRPASGRAVKRFFGGTSLVRARGLAVAVLADSGGVDELLQRVEGPTP
jgi:hypothetical protein